MIDTQLMGLMDEIRLLVVGWNGYIKLVDTRGISGSLAVFKLCQSTKTPSFGRPSFEEFAKL